jgi:hypothetical protein
VSRKLDVLHDYQAASSSGSHYTFKRFSWLREMGQQKAAVDKVVSFDFSKLQDILGPEDG